ncbi:tumor protein p53-inducible nuclear protein 2 isoform X2 [Xiphophorus hellerii]|uniref:tumor protein p53-inducible nuclear protein 2 isoform X2 n=1 Tax=Xiphophorus hellerii TaxID=8084 RepID=UPI0013B40F97|nr:tumor protein p53-inducible nuclear protein 2-like isoform X2 [Xiphophorus hellerii]
MFQRLSNLLFGEVEEVAADLKGPNPCVTEADEEGWMLVNLADSDCMMQVEDDVGTPLTTQASPHSKLADHQNMQTRTECPASTPRLPHKRRRPHKGQTQDPAAPSEPLSCPSASPPHLGAATPVSLPRRARLSTPSSTPSMSPGSGKGATAETSPMEDLLIEHPSMSVYVSPNNLSMLSSSNLSVVGEESIVSLASSASRVTEPAAPRSPAATRSTVPTRVSRGAAGQAGALAKVTQVARVQRYKARMERRHLSRSHIQRQNRVREQVPRHASHTRSTFLHQPSKRNFCH